MAQYIIALRPVTGHASGLVRVNPDGAQFALRGVSTGRAHLLLQNGRTLSADVVATPGGGTAFIPFRGGERAIGAAVTSRGAVVLIGTMGVKASSILERAQQLLDESKDNPADKAAEELGKRAPSAQTTGLADGVTAAKKSAPVPAAKETVNPKAVVVSAARDEPLSIPVPPIAEIKDVPDATWDGKANPAADSGYPGEGGMEPSAEASKNTYAPPAGEDAAVPTPQPDERTDADGFKAPAEPLEGAYVPPAYGQGSEEAAAALPPEGGQKEGEGCPCDERGAMLASFVLEGREEQAVETEAAPIEITPEDIPFGQDISDARSPHAFYKPMFDEEWPEKSDWDRRLASALSEGDAKKPMTGRRLGVFANAFPGDWPRVNWQVFSHPGGTHLLTTRMENRELYAIPARPTATPPAGVPVSARYSVSRTGQGYWIF